MRNCAVVVFFGKYIRVILYFFENHANSRNYLQWDRRNLVLSSNMVDNNGHAFLFKDSSTGQLKGYILHSNLTATNFFTSPNTYSFPHKTNSCVDTKDMQEYLRNLLQDLMGDSLWLFALLQELITTWYILAFFPKRPSKKVISFQKVPQIPLKQCITIFITFS